MTLLPIVERELRVASRRRFTFWGRLAAAGFALLVFFGLQLLANASRGSFRAGQVQFSILKWMSFLFACTSGVFLTADSLSEEKREGTLGLLFLTDLRGHDVVLGKLISHSLQAFYGLVAAVPIIGMTMLVGGVAGAEFGRAMLVICNTLFFSLCAGLFISSISRDVLKAMNGTLFILIFILVGFIFVDWCLAGWEASQFKPIFTLASPAYLFYETGPYVFRDYWFCLGMQHGLAWGFLICSCICTPRAWQEKSNQTKSSGVSFSQRWRFGSPRARLRRRRRLLPRDPILWLALRDRWLPRFVWCIIIIGLAVLSWSLIYYASWQPLQAAAYLQYVIGFGLLLWLASQASRFFVDAIRTGALELMLVTPVTSEQVVRGQWAALWRTFLAPALVLVLVQVAGEVALYHEMTKNMRGVTFPAGYNYLSNQLITEGVNVFKFLSNLAAVAWFGMWMGITTRKISIAVFKTICFVIVLPAIALTFSQGMMIFMLILAKWPPWTGIVLGGGLSVSKNIFFIILARQRLFAGFRGALLREGRLAPVALPPPQPPPFSRPPPIVSAGAG